MTRQARTEVHYSQLHTIHLCSLAPREHQRELAYIINSLLRMDDAMAAPHLAVIVRAINTLVVTRRGTIEMLRFPPNGVTYRGGGLPDEHRAFFHADRKYWVPGRPSHATWQTGS